MEPCSAWRIVVDASVVVTGAAAIIAAIYSAKQARSTAKVNAATMAGIQEERARKDEDARYLTWLEAQLAEQIPRELRREALTEGERAFFDRALREDWLVTIGASHGPGYTYKFRRLRDINDPLPTIGTRNR